MKELESAENSIAVDGKSGRTQNRSSSNDEVETLNDNVFEENKTTKTTIDLTDKDLHEEYNKLKYSQTCKVCSDKEVHLPF